MKPLLLAILLTLSTIAFGQDSQRFRLAVSDTVNGVKTVSITTEKNAFCPQFYVSALNVLGAKNFSWSSYNNAIGYAVPDFDSNYPPRDLPHFLISKDFVLSIEFGAEVKYFVSGRLVYTSPNRPIVGEEYYLDVWDPYTLFHVKVNIGKLPSPVPAQQVVEVPIASDPIYVQNYIPIPEPQPDAVETKEERIARRKESFFWF